MIEPPPELYETVLRQCAARTPEPWYPRTFAEAAGVDRGALDAALERLRMRGLVQLTEWQPGNGQGYRLTAEGERVLHNAGLLTRVRSGSVPEARPRDEGVPRRGNRAATPYERGEVVREALINDTQPPVVTFLLIGINVAVFLYELALTVQMQIPLSKCMFWMDPTVLNRTGAVSIGNVLNGQWWRLLTSFFVHIGFLHIATNMYALYIIGPLVERFLGRWRYLLLYLVAGFGGSCLGVIGNLGGCAGASGAICGLLGALVAWTFLNRQYLPPPVLASIKRWLVINTFLIAAISFIPGVSWSGHLGGAVFGLVGAALLNVQRFGSRPVRVLALAAVLVLPLVGVASLLYYEKASPQLRRILETEGAHERAVREKKEIDQFNNVVLDQFYAQMSPVQEAYPEEIAPVLNRNPRRRTPEQVTKGLTALDDGRKKLEKAGAILANAGPYTSARLTEAQQAGQEYVTEWIKLFDLSERCLRAGKDWNEKEEQQLQEQYHRALAARNRWYSVLRGK
jgi:membrane associated rhomboid family serine protease/DNA-binding PadR family transcriptional regulator